jgi:hypothetical protein
VTDSLDLPSEKSPEPKQKGLVLTRFLRWIGAATFIGGGASFLVEGWTDAGVFSRQLLWAVGTLIMTILGVVAARRWRDPIGARVFLGLAAATIPAHFAQVGSAIHALQVEHIGSVGAALGASGILVLLLPPLALGVSALVRRRGRTLATAIFVLSAPLLLPTRDPSWIAAIAGLQVGAWLLLEATLFRREALFDTVEGVAARLMLLAPVVITLVRNAFYPTTPIWVAATVASPSLVLLAWPALRGLSGRRWMTVQATGVAGLAAAVALCVPPALPLALALGAVLLAGGEVVSSRPVVLAWCGAGFLAAGAVASYFEPGLTSALAVVPAGTLHVVAAFRRRNARLAVVTMVATLAATVAHLIGLVRLPRHDLWIPAVALSVLLLGLSSLLESRRAQLERVFSRLHQHFASGNRS